MKNKIFIILAVVLGMILLIQTTYIISLERNQQIYLAQQRFRYRMPYLRLQDDLVHQPMQRSMRLAPRLNNYFVMQEMPNEYLVIVYLPGLSKEEIKVELKDRYLTVSGAHETRSQKSGRNFQEQQASSGSFLQVIALPGDAQEKNVTSIYKEGSLTVHIPKKMEAKKEAKKIKVE